MLVAETMQKNILHSASEMSTLCFCVFSSSQSLLKSDYQTALLAALAELRYSMNKFGERYVMIIGTLKMPMLCVIILAVEVPFQLHAALVLEQELVPSGWMVLTAQGQRMPSVNALLKNGDSTTVPILKMLVLYVQVRDKCAKSKPSKRRWKFLSIPSFSNCPTLP